jgi:hypothetical protein
MHQKSPASIQELRADGCCAGPRFAADDTVLHRGKVLVRRLIAEFVPYVLEMS